MTHSSHSRITPRRLTRCAALIVLLAALVSAVPALADDYDDVSALMRSGRMVDAMALADKYLTNRPRDPQMRFLKGMIQRETGKGDDALNTFKSLTEEFPELPEPHNNLAALYASRNEIEKARASLEMAIRTNPNYATAHENLGDVYARLAANAYGRALQLNGANAALPPKIRSIQQVIGAPAAIGSSAVPAAPAATSPISPISPISPVSPVSPTSPKGNAP
jgi:tetratricopeptide (TPR) repeat protein